MAHPWANGQVERINGLVLDSLKKRLYDANTKKGGKWIQELPHVVWGLRTQPSKATGQSPFFLTYGSEAILPAYIMWKSLRVESYQEGEADEARQLELDSVEEARINALTQGYNEGFTDADGNEVPNSWNIEHLRKFYPWSKQSSVVSRFI